MLRSSILILLFSLVWPDSLFAEKILCLSDYQGRGKAATLERLLDTVYSNEGSVDTVVVAGDYIVADDLLISIWNKLSGFPNTKLPEVFFAKGNHDSACAMSLDFSHPLPSATALDKIHLPNRKPGQVTAFHKNGLMFIVTDPFLSFKRKGYTMRQLNRIEALLSASKCTHAFVVGHMPAFPKYRHIGKSIDHFPHARDRLVRILAIHGAHFVHGHDHYAHLMRIEDSLHIDCGSVNGQYGSAAIIDADSGVVSIRFYEVFMQEEREYPSIAFQFMAADKFVEHCAFDRKHLNIEGNRPVLLWGSRQVPPSRQRYIEVGMMESNLEYFLDWINYLL
jgi:predicted phosphodiesterase